MGAGWFWRWQWATSRGTIVYVLLAFQQPTGEMLRAVDKAMQPEFVGLWLREPSVDK